MLSFVVAGLGGTAVMCWLWPAWVRAAPLVELAPEGVPRRVRGLVVVAVGIIGFAAVIQSPAVLIEGALLAHIVRRQQRSAAKRAVDASVLDGLVLVVDQMTAELRSGASLRTAFGEAVSPNVPMIQHEALARAGAVMRSGATLEEAIEAIGRECTEVAMVATTLEVLHRSGAPAERALERAGDTLRDRSAAEADARTQSQQAMASAAMLAVLPGFFAVLGAAAERDLLDFYVHSVAGLICIVSSTILSWMGWLWIERAVWTKQ